MPLTFIEFQGKSYPSHQSIGGASLWIRPLAQFYCVGKGLDIGYYKEKWMLPGAIGIEPSVDPTYHAMHLPKGEFDFIHSSHCLEHVKENWYDVVDYWLSKIKIGGILFLYLPHKSQEYWQSFSNRKHIHQFEGPEIGSYLQALGHKVYVSGCDFNNSFVVICEKMESPTVESICERFNIQPQLLSTAENGKVSLSGKVFDTIKDLLPPNQHIEHNGKHYILEYPWNA